MSTEKTFTQEEVNKIVQDRLAQERRKNSLNGDQAQLLQEALSRAEKAEKEIEKYKKSAADSKIKEALISALTLQKCIQPEQISKLIADKVKLLDNGNVAYICDDGKEKSVADGVKEYLEANTWAVKANGFGGGGSTGSNVTISKDAALRAAFGLPAIEE